MTKTEIANIALAKFREGRITNIESTTDPVAVVMNDQYDHALELVLEEHRWNFAGKRVTLTKLSDDPPFGWDHQYQLPSDLIRLKDVNGEDVEASSRLFAIEGTALLTNDDTVTITYVAKVTDTNLFTPSFVEALCFKLASITCARLTGDTELAIMLDKQYNYALSKAIHNDTKAAGSRDRNLMQRLMDSAPILGGSYRYPSAGSAGGGSSSSSGTVPAHKHGLTDLLQSSATDGQTIVWNAAEERWEAGDAGGASPLTTKGDIFAYDTNDARLPVGTDGQFLKADSTQPTGLKWETASGTGDLLAANNLSELTPTAATARANLGLGTAATSNTGDFATASHTHAAGDITSGVMDNARISAGNVTQHQAALSLTASQVSDFDAEVSNNTYVAANTAKVSNATHTGEVTGSTALTIDKTAISGKTLVTAAAGDHILVGDASDTDNLKKVTAQSIADLAAGGGDVSKVGTPAGSQIGVWTGDGTIEGTANLTWNGSTLYTSGTLSAGGAITAGGTIDGRDVAADGTKLDLLDAVITPTDNASAVNDVGIANAATGNAPAISAVGTDPNIDLDINAKGTGNISLGNFVFNADQSVTAANDNHVLTYDNATGEIGLEAAAAGGGDVTKIGTPVDNQVGVWTGDGTIEGTTGLTYDGSSLGVTGNITVTGTVDGRDVATDGTTLDGNVDYLPRVLSTTAKTTGFTAVIGETHYVNTSAGGFTATLPAVASGQGRIAFYFTGTGNSLTVDPNAAETINGKSSIKLDHGHNTIENDGTEWKLIQRSGISPFRLDPAQITANQDGYNPTDWSHGVTHLYIDSDASREIQGFEENGFHDMEQVIVTNDGSNDIIIKHDTSTTVANRVLVDGGADFTLGANQTGILMRDGTVNKWRFYGISSGSGSVATDTIWDAAGDLAIGTGADTATRLAIGTNGQVLTSNGTTAVWAAAGAADNLGNHTATQDLNMAGFNVDSADSIYLDEKAAADVNVAGDGQLWVKDSAPNLLMFTDDDGNDGQVINDFTTVYDYIFIPAGAAIPRTTNGAEAGTPVELATNDIMLENLAFDTATEEAAGFWITLPLGWDAGTIKVKPYWTAASGTGTVKWDFAARAYADDDAIDQVLGTEQGVTDTLLLANDMHIAPTTSALTIGGTPADGEPFYLQVARDVATDTLGVDALLIGFSIEFGRKVKLATAL